MELLPNSAEIRRAEGAAAEAGTPAYSLMERAGRAIADAALAMAGGGGRIVILCGPGNNGGDGYVAARLLAEAGASVEVAALCDPGELKGDAARAASAWTGPVGQGPDSALDGAALAIDALFGTGLRRDLDGKALQIVERLNGARVPVLSVDVPSGVDADTGEIRGVAVRATRTLALGARKPGHLLLPGREAAGWVDVADIGLPTGAVAASGAKTYANAPALWNAALPRPSAGGHKYDRGHAVVLSGGVAHTGAARLAARGALRAGAGLVTVVCAGRALAINAAHLTAIMLRTAEDADELSDLLSDERFNSLVLGPALGVGEGTRASVSAALEADRATVLDADALTSFAGAAGDLRGAIGAHRENAVVLTPHAGEFARLFSGSGEAAAIGAESARLIKARQAAAFMSAVVVLKGPDTVIAAPDGRAAINQNGSPYLATAGSGDVLCGLIAGLMAQGMPAFEAASAAVWMHADASTRFGPGLISEDLPDMMPAVLRDLYGAG